MADWYWVTGINPEPWSVGTAYVRGGGGKGAGISPNGKVQMYQEGFAEEFEAQNPHFLLRIGDLSVTFYFWRSSAHGNVADATNLQKATEDALQKILYVNDKHNRHVQSYVMEQTPTTAPHILVVIDDFVRPEIEPPAGVIIPKYADTNWEPPDEELF
jgi:Holliday junction resolvase RusA-like endonuclease